jgi:hypothetical protein
MSRSAPLKVLAISDTRGWAFDRNMLDMEKALGKRAAVTHFYVEDYKGTQKLPDWGAYDVIFNVYHRNPFTPPWEKTVGALRNPWFSPQHRVPPGPEEFAFVSRHRAFQVCLAPTYGQLAPHCDNVVYLTNPVDMDRFPTPTTLTDTLVAEWNGNAGHDSAGKGADVKGFRSIIEPACEGAEIPLVYAEYRENRLPPEAMPDFYQQANVALCASLYEGASNSVMEAMASGLAVLATDVGNHREMRDSQLLAFQRTGIWLVDRRPSAFVEALSVLRADPSRAAAMGEVNRQSIKQDWSWEVWGDRYYEFLLRGAT